MALDIQIDLSELEQYVRRLGENDQFLEQELRRAMDSSVDLLRAEAVSRTPVNFGALRASIDTQVRGAGLGIEGMVVSPLDYAPVVEFGRRPGQAFPPIGPIELWVRRKLKVGPDESRSVAFLVARKIARQGTTGAFMFTKAMEEKERDVIKQFEAAISRLLNRLANL